MERAKGSMWKGQKVPNVDPQAQEKNKARRTAPSSHVYPAGRPTRSTVHWGKGLGGGPLRKEGCRCPMAGKTQLSEKVRPGGVMFSPRKKNNPAERQTPGWKVQPS